MYLVTNMYLHCVVQNYKHYENIYCAVKFVNRQIIILIHKPKIVLHSLEISNVFLLHVLFSLWCVGSMIMVMCI